MQILLQTCTPISHVLRTMSTESWLPRQLDLKIEIEKVCALSGTHRAVKVLKYRKTIAR